MLIKKYILITAAIVASGAQAEGELAKMVRFAPPLTIPIISRGLLTATAYLSETALVYTTNADATNKMIRILIWNNGECTEKVFGFHRYPIETMSRLPDGKLLSTDDKGFVRIWDAPANGNYDATIDPNDRKYVEITPKDRAPFTDIDVFADGRILTTDKNRSRLRVWADASFQSYTEIETSSQTTSIAVLNNNKILVANCLTGHIFTIDLKTKEQRFLEHVHGIRLMKSIGNDRFLTISQYSNEIRIWDAAIEGSMCIGTWRDLKALAVHNNVAITGDLGEVQIWHLPTLPEATSV
jgi:WD40 repeat protein